MTVPAPAAPGAWQLEFVHQVAAHTDAGLPAGLVRVLAWLVVAEPEYQSATQIQAALRLSAGSVSAAAGTLVRSGLVLRRTFPGDRRAYYLLHPAGWERLLAIRLAQLTAVRRDAEAAIAACGGTARLAAMRDFYLACETPLAALLGSDGDPSAPGKPKRTKKKSGSKAR